MEVIRLVLYARRLISTFDPMEFSMIDVLGTRAMQTDFGGWGYCPPSKPSCSKRVSSHKAANPPMGFGVMDLVQRVPLWGAFDW